MSEFFQHYPLKATEAIMDVLSRPEVMQPDVAKISAVVK